VEEGLCDGAVLYHAHVSKSKSEASAQRAAKDEAAKLRAQRRQQQEENVRRKQVGGVWRVCCSRWRLCVPLLACHVHVQHRHVHGTRASAPQAEQRRLADLQQQAAAAKQDPAAKVAAARKNWWGQQEAEARGERAAAAAAAGDSGGGGGADAEEDDDIAYYRCVDAWVRWHASWCGVEVHDAGAPRRGSSLPGSGAKRP
jgi:hypothetical protein